jgi:histidinol dehydrogenase|tara:strand:+ start:1388 stop:2671 length:1284 start_codon:yes stop_codon:yes gene_type:complete
LKTIKYPNKDTWSEILKRPAQEKKNLEAIVLGVFEDIKKDGDKALKSYTAKFDGAELDNLLVSEQEFAEATASTPDNLKAAIDNAAQNIYKFHKVQETEEEKIETQPGVECWRKVTPIEKVGLYIPGGTAPLFSTVLMLAIPAKIAGCKEIVLCTPPNKEGKINPAILYAASSVGCTKVFKLGGIQAIGAMTYGTESVPSVYKIFGPGNQFVTAAKQMASLDGVAIDMPAGPSEVLVYGDETGNADFIASDLLSQAEHGADSQVVFVTCVDSLIDDVKEAVLKQLAELPRKDVASKALDNSTLILMNNEAEALELINEYGPEHLIIGAKNEELFMNSVTNAGSVFLGNYTPESAGDYASGTNHTLPTNGYAKSYSGVSLESFTKKITYQRISKEGLKALGPTIEIMAEAEELFAHKNAVTLRLNELK